MGIVAVEQLAHLTVTVLVVVLDIVTQLELAEVAVTAPPPKLPLMFIVPVRL